MFNCCFLSLKIKTVFPVDTMSGKSKSSRNLVFYTKYNGRRIYAWEWSKSGEPLSEAQLAQIEAFKSAAALAHADMADPVKSTEGEEKAAASKGKYLTGLGCAMAHYLAAEEQA